MPAAKEKREGLQGLLENLLEDVEGEASLRKLFGQGLKYERTHRRVYWRQPPQAIGEAVAEAPALLATAGAGGGFQVIYVRLSGGLHRAAERTVVNHLLRTHPHALFVFSNRAQAAWHFVNARIASGRSGAPCWRRILRRVSASTPNGLRTAAACLARVAKGELEARAGKPLRQLPPPDIQALHDAAFDAEAAARDFYEGFRVVLEALEADLSAQTGAERWAHQYALLFLNRCLLVCFVQRKPWPGSGAAFMRAFWRAYREADEPQDTFAPRWLRALFFEALGGGAAASRHAQFPAHIRRALRHAPRLGGGFFRPGPLDAERRQHGASVTDERFRQVFTFLESHAFVLAEDRPLDQTVAVNPAMIGKVYENLVSASGEDGERADAGIFYTPRTEIALMCRLSLVDYLAGRLGKEHKDTIYAVVFALTLEEQRRADRHCARAGLWPRLRHLLRGVTVVDPACGSGAFLIGMLQVLDDLLRRAGAHLGTDESACEQKRGIIERSLYGVDVMEGACGAARLRLRLSLLASAALPPPDVTLNIRTGDALVPDALVPAEAAGGAFAWETAFAGVFSGEEPGFDVVIGNPPYVRHENIADPALPPEEITRRSKRRYKEKLARGAREAFPAFFQNGSVQKKNRAGIENSIDKRSDLYFYFYFLGLRLLNSRGTFCFISSNAWLDVNYGRTLQAFLLRRVHVKLVIDNREHRSFAGAGVNTVVTLFSAPFSAPEEAASGALEATARFVMLKVPFEEALHSELWAELERAEERRSTSAYRVFAAPQSALLQSEADLSEEASRRTERAAGSVAYGAGKWGGKYLRAPDIYWKIVKRAGGKLCRLGDVASVKRGFTTGANRFFYLTRDEIETWKIEERFLAPLLKTPRETKRVVLKACDFKYRVFLCSQPRARLEGTRALAYIRWGEREGFHRRPSLSGKERWWSLRSHQAPALVSPCSVSGLYCARVNECRVRVDKRLYEIRPLPANASSRRVQALAASLNATLTSLFLELLTRTGLGEGLLDMAVYELEDCPIVHPCLLEGTRLEDRKIKPYRQELRDERRHRLDAQVFGALGLSKPEQQEVRDAVRALIGQRRAKAKSAG